MNTPNPSTRWFEWSGGRGGVKYYDKEAKVSVDVALPFKFILLDKLATITGWHDPSQSGIYSNEVRDTVKETLVVKSFKGGVLAQGHYKDIKDKVSIAGGSYTANIYVAYKDGGTLKIGAMKFKGAALSSWMEFEKNNRRDLYTKAVLITGMTAGKKGSITYQTPTFALDDVSPEAEKLATALDIELQQYLNGYFASRTSEQVTSHEDVVPESEREYAMKEVPPPTEHTPPDDLPF
jgi:hypothetical protein